MTMPKDIQELRERDDLPEIREQLEEKPNVYLTGIGYRRKGGEKTDEPAIIASVYPKKEEDELNDNEIIPEEINGIRIDVHALEEEPEEQRADSRSSELRPIPGGAQLTSTGSYGTFGFPVMDTSNSTPVMLTAAHVPAEDTDSSIDDIIGRDVYQPSTDTAYLVGSIYDAEYDELDSSGQDWAAVEFDDSSWITNEVFGFGKMGSYMEPSFDQPLVFSGRSSSGNGIRKTELVAIDVYNSSGRGPCYQYNDTTEGGDSGMVVGQLDETGTFRPCALHISSGSYGLMIDEIINNRRPEYELITDSSYHEVPNYSGSAYFEGCVSGEDYDYATVTASVWNGGGEFGVTYVEILDTNGRVFDSKTVAMDGMDQRRVVLDVPQGGDYVFRTRDVEHPHDDRNYVATVNDVPEFPRGVYVQENGEKIRVDDKK